MLRYFFRRLITAVLVLFGVTFLTFGLMTIAPGDPAQEVAFARYGGVGSADTHTIEWIRTNEGLDRPFLVQYFKWLKHVLMFDFGRSLVEGVPVFELIRTRFKRTVELSIAAMIFAVVVSIPLGILSGTRQGSWIDSTATTLSVGGLSMPNFWLGLLLILVFSVKLKWLPSFGSGDWHHMIMPTLTLGTALTAYTTRILRSAIIETLHSDYLRCLRARGLPEMSIIGKHALRNASIPVVTVVGLELGMMFEGAVITETIFAWPGLGQLLVHAIENRDYPLIQGTVLFIAAVFVILNSVVDVLYCYLDPRIRIS
jgi:peptide/nickel transport system permease protein